MAKYENTWRMKPYLVKKGAQANLKSFGGDIVKEFEQDESAFGPAFFNDLVSKMLLFNMVDAAILQTDWYKEERGLKAEMVTFSIALLRHTLLAKTKDINLSSIYQSQRVSDSLLYTIVSLAHKIRDCITDFEFTGGVTNPSEFCKSEKGWNKILTIEVDLSGLGNSDILSADEAREAKKETREINKASKTITGLEYVLATSAQEWNLIAEYNAKTYPSTHKNVGIPRMCAELHRSGKMPSDKQLNYAKEIRVAAYQDGFDYIG